VNNRFVTARVVSWGISAMSGETSLQFLATARYNRMHKHDGLAPVEFFENRKKGGIAEPLGSSAVAVAGQNANPVRLQYVERIFDFSQAAFGIRQRHDGKQTKPPRMAPCEVGRIFVAETRSAARCLSIAKPHAGQCE
jgi:hypothetical protein